MPALRTILPVLCVLGFLLPLMRAEDQPVVDDTGSVVGMVANTQTIHCKSNNKSTKGAKTNADNPVQMVVKNCVPTHALRALINN